jgi:hypothetical protein
VIVMMTAAPISVINGASAAKLERGSDGIMCCAPKVACA